MLPLLLLLPGILVPQPVAVVEIHGFIGEDVDPNQVVQRLEGIEQDYAALILDIDSPGGTAVGSHRIVEALQKFDKPKVALVGNSGVSGAYWVAAACDVIVSDELSFVGSIGASSRFVNLGQLAEDYGVSVENIAYPENKSFGSPFREMTPAERKYAQALSNSAGQFFIDDVTRLRPAAGDYADGLPYVAKDAPELVDEFGGFQKAVSEAEKLTGTKLEPERFESSGLLDFLKKLRNLKSEGLFDVFELVFQVPYYL